jgi:hypothetical protein
VKLKNFWFKTFFLAWRSDSHLNPSYLGGRDHENHGLQQQKVHENPSQPIKAECGGTCLTFQLHRNHKQGGSWSRLASGKNLRPYSKSNDWKGLGVWLKWYSVPSTGLIVQAMDHQQDQPTNQKSFFTLGEPMA